MTIIGWLRKKRRAHHERQQLTARHQRQCAIAQEAFERAYPHRALVWVLEPQQDIVCLCHGVTIPPQRSWWLVDEIAGAAREMTYEEAKKIITIPPWR